MEGKYGKGISRGEKVKTEKNKIKFNDLPKKVRAFFALIPVVVSFGGLILTKVDNDIWFLLKYGQVICEKGLVPKDPLSMHSDFDIIIQQWLSDVVFWKVYSFAGKTGLLVLACLCTVFITFMVYKVCMRVSSGNFFISYITCLFSSFFLMMFVCTTRPQALTMCIFVTELYFYERYMEKSNWKFLIPIPLLSALLINIHASMWLVQFVILMPFIVDSFKFDFKFIKCQGAKIFPLIVSAAVTFLAGFLNPYGVNAITYLFRSYGVEEINNSVSEMKILSVNTINGFAFAAVFALLLIVNFRNKGNVIDSRIRNILFVAGFGFMMFSHIRNVMFFFVFAPYSLAYCFRDFNPSVPYEEITSKKSKVLSSCLLILLIAVVGCFFAFDGLGAVNNMIPVTSENYIEYEEAKCEKATDYILDNYPNGSQLKIYTCYNDGNYLEFNGLHTYIDTRAEIFLEANNGKDDVFIEYYNLQRSKLDFEEFLDKYDFDLLLVNENDVLYNYLPKNNNYKLVYSDDYCSVYENVK